MEEEDDEGKKKKRSYFRDKRKFRLITADV